MFYWLRPDWRIKNKFGMKKNFAILVLALCSLGISAQVNEAYRAYIEQWKAEALRQQSEYGVPASITLAQGLLESAAGQSELAREANNHFGIKCTSDWVGDTYRHDDETRNECFRSYDNAADSYRDHSLFLRRKRYEPLFALNVADYKGWARGLKECGYATDPQYPAKLIRIIEDYGLNNLNSSPAAPAGQAASSLPVVVQQSPVIQNVMNDPEPPYIPPFTAKEEKRRFEALHHFDKMNGVRYAVASDGDTYANVAFRLNMRERDLREYNDALGRELVPGDRIYLSRKKKKGIAEHQLLWVHPGESLWVISQREGIQLECIYQYNGLLRDIQTFKTRQTIWLCKPKQQ